MVQVVQNRNKSKITTSFSFKLKVNIVDKMSEVAAIQGKSCLDDFD